MIELTYLLTCSYDNTGHRFLLLVIDNHIAAEISWFYR